MSVVRRIFRRIVSWFGFIGHGFMFGLGFILFGVDCALLFCLLCFSRVVFNVFYFWIFLIFVCDCLVFMSDVLRLFSCSLKGCAVLL